MSLNPLFLRRSDPMITPPYEFHVESILVLTLPKFHSDLTLRRGEMLVSLTTTSPKMKSSAK